ncbi:MAG: replication initiation factor domain-containing protein [Geobacteraceae bacterium]|nr:replication initiation factor domain-containing protein [Geobacteraceae bacterium]
MSTSTVKPPSSNTGATITTTAAQNLEIPKENRVLIDWVSFTLPDVNPQNAIALLHLEMGAFTTLGGSMGYKQSYRLGNISVFFDGTEEMGCHVTMSGQGCREFEAISKVKDWRSLFALVHANKGHFTRLDVAFDNVDNSLKMSTIWRCVKRGHIKSVLTSGRRVESFKLTHDGTLSKGQTLYLGSVQSNVQYRFYDKAAQLELEEQGTWVRLEMQLRKDRADSLAEHIIMNKQTIAELATGIINSHFAFINLDDSNKTRCSLKTWWSTWLLHTSKLKLIKAKAQKILFDIMAHLENQYAPSFALLAQGLNNKVFGAFFSGMLKLGKERFTARHQQILEASKLTAQSFNLRSLSYDSPF